MRSVISSSKTVAEARRSWLRGGEGVVVDVEGLEALSLKEGWEASLKGGVWQDSKVPFRHNMVVYGAVNFIVGG